MFWLVGFLQRQSIPLVLSLVILIPFLIHYITTTLFYRTHGSKNSNRKPLTIPYWVPGFCHGLGLLSRPSAYLALLVKKYGDYAPFMVKVGLSSYLIIRDLDHVQQVFQTPNNAIATPDLEFYTKVLDAPPDAINYYKSVARRDTEGDKVHHAHVTIPRKYFTGPALKALTDTYISIFRRNMSNKMFQVNSWTQIEDLWSFFEIDITRAMTETLFGSALLKQYPKLAQDLCDFNSKIEEYLPGLPRFMVSASAAPRDRLLAQLKKWLQEKHGGTDFAKIDERDPMWDENKGSKYIQERDNVFANCPAFNYQGRAVESLSVLQRYIEPLNNSRSRTANLYSLVSIIMPFTFWSVVEVLRNPALVNFLTTEIAQHRDPKTNDLDITAITSLPNLQSLYTEIRRLRTATHSLRTVENTPIRLSGNWTVPKHTHILTFSQDLGLNTPLWADHAKANPHLLSRPLEEFWPDRFLVADKSRSTTRYRKGRHSVTTGTFDLRGQGVDVLCSMLGFADYGDAEREFATAVGTATLAVLLGEFEVEICDEGDVEGVVPLGWEGAWGCGRPVEGVKVRLRKRAEGEKVV
ncbi:cytochrome P450 [Byssothecium circinans]|uniref:Cytochrome P450 n=1 Tax=Byssothecium circinans TaxID=147558 RepID=A0A6A5UAR0_9PLEO|nr:cytochrome P450 [Byssothecium circinans]